MLLFGTAHCDSRAVVYSNGARFLERICYDKSSTVTGAATFAPITRSARIHQVEKADILTRVRGKTNYISSNFPPPHSRGNVLVV